MKLTEQEVLALPIECDDSGATTVREFLQCLLARVWEEQEGFSGKRPFGNSGWDGPVVDALLDAGMIQDEREANRVMLKVIAAL